VKVAALALTAASTVVLGIPAIPGRAAIALPMVALVTLISALEPFFIGPVPAYRVELVTRLGSYTCPYTATGPDMFEALVRLRRQLEPDGLMVAVQGSRRDTYPSGMARDMGGGMQVYVMRPGLRGRREDLVGTLDDALPDQLATVGEQRAFAEAWRAEEGKQ
jgi:hypothetical protein